MKGISRYVFFAMLTVGMLLVSACGATTQFSDDSGSAKPLPSLVSVSGIIEAINGNQWTVDGQVIIVDASMLDDDDLENYKVGDFVELEVETLADGSVVARSVDSGDDKSNENDDDSSNTNDDSSNANDDDANENDDDASDSDDDDSNENDDASNDNEDDSNENDDSNDNEDDPEDDASNDNEDDPEDDNDDDSNENDD